MIEVTTFVSFHDREVAAFEEAAGFENIHHKSKWDCRREKEIRQARSEQNRSKGQVMKRKQMTIKNILMPIFYMQCLQRKPQRRISCFGMNRSFEAGFRSLIRCVIKIM